MGIGKVLQPAVSLQFLLRLVGLAEFGESRSLAPSFFIFTDFQIFPVGKRFETGRHKGGVMRKAGILFYVILQCTWGIIQTTAGLFLFLKYVRCPHRLFGGAVHTGWERRDGVSLGLFIFSPKPEGGDGGIKPPDGLTIHEYGHTFQSLMLGPFYLPVIGIPSALWANGKKYRELRENYGVPYSFCFAEGWADRLGKKMTDKFEGQTSGREET